MTEEALLGGACLGIANWGSPAWQAAFYPETLPEEWRLAYYGAHYSCVWVRHEAWSRLSPEEARFWVSETPERFRFVLEKPASQEPADALVLNILQPRLGIVCAVDDPALFLFDASTDLRAVSDELKKRTEAKEAIFLISRDGNHERIEQVNVLLQLFGL